MCLRSINIQCISFPKDGKITSYRKCRLTDCCHTFTQHAKEVVSNSPGLVDFAIGLANSLLNFSAQLASEVFLGFQITEQLLSKTFFWFS